MYGVASHRTLLGLARVVGWSVEEIFPIESDWFLFQPVSSSGAPSLETAFVQAYLPQRKSPYSLDMYESALVHALECA